MADKEPLPAAVITTPRTEQGTQLLVELVGKMEALGKSFAELPVNMQRDFKAQADEIAKLADGVQAAQANAAKRFEALGGHYHRGGDYRGPFACRDDARNFGLMVAAIATNRGENFALPQAGIKPTPGSSGGYLAPDTLLTGIVRNVEEYGVFERNCPAVSVAAESGGMAKRTGGLTVYYPELEAAPTASAPTFGRVEFSCKRWSALCLVDRWMLADNLAVALGDFVAMELGFAIGYAQDLNAFMGDGTSTYARVVGAFKRAGTSQLTVTGDSGDDTFAEVIAKTTYYLAAMLGKVPAWVHARDPKFYMHLSTFFGFLGVRDSVGMPIASVYIGESKPAFRLMGYPVEITQVAPSSTAVSTNFALFGALREAFLLARHVKGVEIRTSEHYKFAEGQIAICGDVVQDIVEKDNQAYCQLQTHA